MKIIFKKIKFKNFLSSGNFFIEIELNKHNNTLIKGFNGVGKAQPLYSKILTPTGWKTMGDINIGDSIIGSDGNISKVIDVPFKGETDVYEIKFKDGRKVKCSDEHLWKVWSFFNSKWQWNVVTTNDLLKLKYKKYVQLYIPCNSEDKELPINPYLLGVLIGDGSFTSSSIGFTSFDDEIVKKIESILENTTPRIVKLNLVNSKRKGFFRINYGLKYNKNNFKEEFNNLGLLNKKSCDKFIPESYKNISLNQKIELIRGLMDTDGTCGKNGGLSFTTVSKQLALDFQELIWSIGGICRITEKQTYYDYKGIKNKGKLAYNCNIRYKNPNELFTLTRKKNRCKNYQYKDYLRLEMIDIKLVGKEETKCISLNNKDNLYVTDNYVVTHNSLFLDAICFCLFGKPYRNINKPTLVNSINEKDLLVEGEIEIGKNTYLIRRGIKPNIFELYVNGTLLNQTASSKDYQSYLETHILKINFKSFTQILVLGSSIYIPFMELTAAHRREIIEDILDISVFSTMNTLVKSDSQKNKSDLELNNNEMYNIEDKIKLVKSHIDSLKKLDDNRKLQSELQLKEYYSELVIIQKDIDGLDIKHTNLYDEIQKYDVLNINNNKYKDALIKANFKLKDINKSIEYFNDNNVCSLCNQDIKDEHKHIQLKDLIDKRDKIVNVISSMQSKQDVLNRQSEELSILVDRYEVLSGELDKRNYEKKVKLQLISKLKASIDNEEKLKGSNIDTTKLNDFENQLKSLEEKKEQLINSKVVIETTSILLKDNGIKSVIIKNYIPIINQLINKYLKNMGFNVNFNLNESFEETIKSRFRDTFTYQNFSEGEKQRINLALLFAWRQIAKIKSSININLLIMDEIFDSSLDEKGMECLYKLLKTKEIKDNSNIYIISHKKDLSEDFFDRLIVVDKINNFTKYNIKDNIKNE